MKKTNVHKIIKFTLLELLVVVAVIAILLSLLLPFMSRAREKARIAVCMSNVSQIYRGSTLYAKNHNNRLPTPHYRRGGRKVFPHALKLELANELRLYNDSSQTEGTVYDCPSNDNAPRGVSVLAGDDIYLVDQYSLLTYFNKYSGTKFYGENSPVYLGDEGAVVSETVLWWVNHGGVGLESNHGSGDHSNIWTDMKYQPTGYNQGLVEGGVKWIYASRLDPSSPMASVNGDSRLYWVEE